MDDDGVAFTMFLILICDPVGSNGNVIVWVNEPEGGDDE